MGSNFQACVSLVRRRGPPKDSRDNDQSLIKVKVVDDAVITHSPPPRSVLPFKPFEVSLEGIGLHGDQHCSNARLISLWELLEVFLCRTGG